MECDLALFTSAIRPIQWACHSDQIAMKSSQIVAPVPTQLKRVDMLTCASKSSRWSAAGAAEEIAPLLKNPRNVIGEFGQIASRNSPNFADGAPAADLMRPYGFMGGVCVISAVLFCDTEKQSL